MKKSLLVILFTTTIPIIAWAFPRIINPKTPSEIQIDLQDLSDDIKDLDIEIQSENAVNVKDFGAVGDGVTADDEAISAALASLPNGGAVYFPRGTYKTEVVPSSNFIIFSDGDATINGSIRIFGSSITIRDITIDNKNTSYGIQALSTPFPIANIKIFNCNIRANTGSAIIMSAASLVNTISSVTIDHNQIIGTTGSGIELVHAISNVWITNNYIKDAGDFGMTLGGEGYSYTYNINILNNIIDNAAWNNPGTAALEFAAMESVNISNNVFLNISSLVPIISNASNARFCTINGNSTRGITSSGVTLRTLFSVVSNNNFYFQSGPFNVIGTTNTISYNVIRSSYPNAMSFGNSPGNIVSGNYISNSTSATNTGVLKFDGPECTNNMVFGNTLAPSEVAGGSLISSVNNASIGTVRDNVSQEGVYQQPTNSQFIAYSTVTQSNVTGDSTAYTVQFSAEFQDFHSDFSTTTFTFTAPHNGMYSFSTLLSLDQLDNTHTYVRVRLVTSNRSYETLIHSTFTASTAIVPSLSTLADMEAGDTAYIQLDVGGGTRTVDVIGNTVVANIRTYFMGSYLR